MRHLYAHASSTPTRRPAYKNRRRHDLAFTSIDHTQRSKIGRAFWWVNVGLRLTNYYIIIIIINVRLVTHADCMYSQVSIYKAIIHVCLSVIPSVCPHDKIKTAENTISKLGTRIIHHDTSSVNEY